MGPTVRSLLAAAAAVVPLLAQATPASWTAERVVDDMTGSVVCRAVSPPALATGATPGRYSVSLVLVASRTQPFVGLRLGDATARFHQQIDGTGIKIGSDAFLRFSARPSPQVLSFSTVPHAAVLDRLAKAESFKVRVRVWPYSETLDTVDIPMHGFAQARQQAAACAGLA